MFERPKAPVFRICFVCTGNICRSPMAEVMFRAKAVARGLGDDIAIESAGTGEWHVGERADPRTRAALLRAGYSGERHRARQFEPEWFARFDLVVTFDRGQQRILRSWAQDEEERSIIQSLLSFDPHQAEIGEVPDPYYGSEELFDHVRDMIDSACTCLLAQLEPVVRTARSAARSCR